MSSFSFTTRVALRYLRALRKSNRIKYLRLLTLCCILGTVAIYLADMWLIPADRSNLSPHQAFLHQALVIGKYAGVLSIGLVGVFVELITRFTIFTTISTFGMFLGTGALVTVISFMSAMRDDLKHKMLGTHAHMIIEAIDRPYLSEYKELMDKVRQVPGVVAATPYLTMEMLIVNSEIRSRKEGVIVRGVDPATLTTVTDLEKYMRAGSVFNLLHPEQALQAVDKTSPIPINALDSSKLLSPRDPNLPGIIIGKELAQNLNIYEKQEIPLGTEVLLASPIGGTSPTGNAPTVIRFQVVGIFYSGMYEYDSKYAYIRLPKLQKLIDLGDEVSGIELKLADLEHSEKFIDPVRQALGPGPDQQGYRVEDWKTRNQSLFASLELEKIVMFIGLCLIILVAASSVISNGLMLVAEKTQEIAILKSMGATDGGILRIFTGLGLSVGILGVGLGVLGGLLACRLLSQFGLPISDDVYYITKVPIVVDPKEVLVICVSALLLVLFATLYPARNAAKLRPVDGLR